MLHGSHTAYGIQLKSAWQAQCESGQEDAVWQSIWLSPFGVASHLFIPLGLCQCIDLQSMSPAQSKLVFLRKAGAWSADVALHDSFKQ